jgi:outer membrane protein assembly factor BamE
MPSLPTLKPYRIDIQQGNFISQEMVSKLKPGMTREQVRFVLGTPLVTDIFHADRWDYVFYREIPGAPTQHRQFSVFFEKDRLVRVAGDVNPAEGSPAAPGKPAANADAAGGAKSDAKKDARN